MNRSNSTSFISFFIFAITFATVTANCSRQASQIEGTTTVVDSDGDGVVDEEDSDGDGIFDSVDDSPGTTASPEGTTPPSGDADSDSDGLADDDDNYDTPSNSDQADVDSEDGEGGGELIYHYLEIETIQEKSDIDDIDESNIYKTFVTDIEILAYNKDDDNSIDSANLAYSISSFSGTFVYDDSSREAISPEFLPSTTISGSTLSINDDNIDYTVSALILTITISSLHTSGTTSEITEEITIMLPNDEEAPKIVAYFPMPDDVASDTYPVTSEISLLFDSSVTDDSLDKLKLYKGSYDSANIVGGDVEFEDGGNYSNTLIIFYPKSDLDFDTTYYAVLTSGVEDYFGNSLDGSFLWEFKTESEIVSTEAPEITYTYAHDGEASDDVIQIVFSHEMADMTGKIKVLEGSDSGSEIDGTITSYGCDSNCSRGALVEFTSLNQWDSGTTYYVVVAGDSKDIYGNKLGDDYEFSFTTIGSEGTGDATTSLTAKNQFSRVLKIK